MNRRFFFTFLLALASFFFSTTAFADEWVYQENVGLNWSGWMWQGTEGTDFDFTADDPSEPDTAMWVQYIAGDSLEFQGMNGFDATGYDTLSFKARGDSIENGDIRIFITEYGKPTSNTAIQLNDYVSQVPAGSWMEVNIPLADLGVNAETIDLIDFRGMNAGTVYYDDIQFKKNDDTFVFFDDATSESVSYLHWNFTKSTTTNPVYRGTKALKFADKNMSDSFGTIWILADGTSPSLDTYEAIEFAIRTDRGINASIMYLDEDHESRRVILGDYLPLHGVTTEWQVVHVPLADLITGPSKYYYELGTKEGIYLQFSHDEPFTIFLDDVRMVGRNGNTGGGGQCTDPQVLGASMQAPPMATLGTGGSCSANNPPPSLYFFDEEKTAGTNRWGWNVSTNAEVSSPVYDGTKAIKVEFNYPNPDGGNSGLQFYSQESFPVKPSSQLIVFSMKGEVDPSSVNVALSDGEGNSVPGAWVTASEYLGVVRPLPSGVGSSSPRVTLPLQDRPSPPSLAGSPSNRGRPEWSISMKCRWWGWMRYWRFRLRSVTNFLVFMK